MFTPPATFSVVISVLFRLLHDEISIVRHKAAKCCGLLINRLANEEDVDWSEQLAQRILGLGMSNTYKIRLTFVHICECLVKQIPSELFLTSFLESLLALSYDKVANIRVAVARRPLGQEGPPQTTQTRGPIRRRPIRIYFQLATSTALLSLHRCKQRLDCYWRVVE